MFSWGKNKDDGRGRKIGWKTMFSIVWQKKTNGEEGKLGRKFSLPGPQFLSSQIRRKMLERKVFSQHFYTNTPFWNQVKRRKKKRKKSKKKKKRESTREKKERE